MLTVTSTGHTSDRRFPCLRRLGPDVIVLFTNDTTGVVLEGDDFLSVGYHNDTWDPTEFVDFFGSVTLTYE